MKMSPAESAATPQGGAQHGGGPWSVVAGVASAGHGGGSIEVGPIMALTPGEVEAIRRLQHGKSVRTGRQRRRAERGNAGTEWHGAEGGAAVGESDGAAGGRGGAGQIGFDRRCQRQRLTVGRPRGAR